MLSNKSPQIGEDQEGMAFKGSVTFLDKILGRKCHYMKIKTCETAMLTTTSPMHCDVHQIPL